MCEKEAKEKYARWIDECEQGECVEGVYAQFRPEYEYCDTLSSDEQQACEQRVDKLVAEAKKMCFPQPPTCYEEAGIWIEERITFCRNNTDEVEIKMCVKEAKENY
jgi:hypothetical protein